MPDETTHYRTSSPHGYLVATEPERKLFSARNILLSGGVAVLIGITGIGGWTAITARAELASTRSEMRQNQLAQDGRVDALTRRAEDLAGRATALESALAMASGRIDVLERQIATLNNDIANVGSVTSRICFKKGNGGEYLAPCAEVR